MTESRNQILEDMVQSLPKRRIIAAAVLVMRHQRGISDDEDWNPPIEEVHDWIDELEADHLLTLRDIAEGLEEASEH
jgi:hypothetical protein